jgi:hypothetical protein
MKFRPWKLMKVGLNLWKRLIHPVATIRVAWDLVLERANQDQKFGEQNRPNGTGDSHYWKMAGIAKMNYKIADRENKLTFNHILTEEYYEALAERDEDKLRAELVQVGAVAMQWVEAIDRKKVRK